MPNGSRNARPPAKWLAAWRGVAGLAIGRAREIFAALDQARSASDAGTPVGSASLIIRERHFRAAGECQRAGTSKIQKPADQPRPRQ